jgi:hypothetical protein
METAPDFKLAPFIMEASISISAFSFKADPRPALKSG